MNILLLGGGQVGATLVEHLVCEAHDITLVDTSQERLQALQARFDIRTVRGVATHPEVLREADADGTDVLIAVTGSDEVNLLSCHIAQQFFDIGTKIARVRHSAYRDQLALKSMLSVDVCVDTDAWIVRDIMHHMDYPGSLDVVDFAQGQVRLVGVQVQSASVWVGKTIGQWQKHLAQACSQVVAIYRHQTAIPVSLDVVITASDVLYVMISASEVREVLRTLGHQHTPHQRLWIAGGGGVGLRLAQAVESLHPVKLIERHRPRAHYIARQLDDTLVLCGHATDDTLLIQEHVEDADLFCALTNQDDTNLIACMQAKALGAKKTLALVNSSRYLHWQTPTGIDLLLSPQQIILGAMLRYLRRSDVIADYTVRQGQAEVIEIIAHGDPNTSQVVGQTIEQLALPPLTTLGALIRDGVLLSLQSDWVIVEGDHVLLWIGDKQQLPEVERLFQVDLSRGD